MAAQVDYQVYKIVRSDGVDTGPGYWPTAADAAAAKAKKAATKDPNEKPTRTKAPMIRLAENSDKFVEWRVKLGILLKQELSQTPNDGLPWYVEFPRGYWLYEKSNRTYVVSGYPNKGKLFKSPQEFGVHLLWLLGNSDNYVDCCCVHCNIPVPGPARPTVVVEEETEKAGPGKPALADNNAATTPAAALPPKRAQPASTSTTGTQPATSTIAPAPWPSPSQAGSVAPVPAPGTASPSPSGLPRTSPASLLYRVGELVWFQTGAAWKLGLILQSTPWVPSVASTHQVLPIGLGMVQQAVVRKEDKDLRPFQAFSVPTVHTEELKNRSFDNIKWDEVLARIQQAEQANPSPATQAAFDTVLLDASKMAATKIHHSLSLFTKMGVKDGASAYYGCFLGAERVEASDILRVKPPAQFERLPNVFFCLKWVRVLGAQPSQPVVFVGMLCHLVEGAQAVADAVAMGREPVAPQSIPWGLREEIAWRQGIDPATPRRLVALQTYQCQERDVRGRFYPTNRLGPILAFPSMQKAKEAKKPALVQLPLNDRLGLGTMSPTISPYLGVKKNRLDMAGISVPHGSRFVFEGSVQEEQL